MDTPRESNMKAFFTSDLHLGHANVAAYCNRPWLKDGDYNFDDKRWTTDEARKRVADNMNEGLIKNWNMRVKPRDVVYHLGDFCCKGNEKGVPGCKTKAESWERELNGRIVHISGNHDANNSVKNALEFAVIKFGNHTWFMSHRPPWQLEYEIPSHVDTFLCGHVHEKWHISEYDSKPVINVGVDVNRYMPLKKQELIQMRDRL